MNYLAENAAPIWAAGAVLLTMAGIVYAYTRSPKALAAVGGVVALTAAALVTERLVITPREAVQGQLARLMDAIEANDLPAVLALVSPTATDVRSDAETLMPMLEVERAGPASSIEVTLPVGEEPTTASAEMNALIQVRHKESGMTGGYFDPVTVHFAREGGRWLVTGYTADDDWRRGVAELRRGR